MAAVQVKFDRQNTNEQAIAKKTTDAGTIFFTKDKHQIIIGGEIYGGQQHKIIEHSHDIYTQIPASQTDNDFQAYLAKLYNMDLSTGKADPVNPDDYYVYKYQVVDNHAGEGTKHTTGSNPDGAHQSTASVINPSTGQPYAAGSVPVIYARVCYVCTVAPVITYDSTTTKYTCTSLGSWQQLGGEYDADKVYLSGDITMAGNYSQVGNLTKTQNGTSTFACKGMTVKEALMAILMKVEWPSGSYTITKAANGPSQKSLAYAELPAFKVFKGSGESTDTEIFDGAVVTVGTNIYIGGTKESHKTAANRQLTFKTMSTPSTETYTVVDTDSWKLTTSGQIASWGITDTIDGESKTTPIYGKWKNNTRSLTLTYSKDTLADAGIGGYIQMIKTSGDLNVTYDTGITGLTDNKATWAKTHTAGSEHSCNGGTIPSIGLGSITIKLCADQNDIFSRIASGGSSADGKSLVANGINSYYLKNNIGTTDQVAIAQATHKTNSQSDTNVSDGHPNVSLTGTKAPYTTITIHSVYALRHNGKNATISVKDSDASGWSTATPGTALSTEVREAYDVFGSASSKTYYIQWTGATGKNRYIDVPARRLPTGTGGVFVDADYCTLKVRGRNSAGAFDDSVTKTFTAVTGAPTGYKRYVQGQAPSGVPSGVDDGPAVLEVTISK